MCISHLLTCTLHFGVFPYPIAVSLSFQQVDLDDHTSGQIVSGLDATCFDRVGMTTLSVHTIVLWAQYGGDKKIPRQTPEILPCRDHLQKESATQPCSCKELSLALCRGYSSRVEALDSLVA